MIQRTLKWWLFLLLGFYFFGLLTVLPIPEEAKWFRPQWLLLFTILCQTYQPKRFGIALAFGLGLLADLLLGMKMGENALIFTLIYFLMAFLRPSLFKIFLMVCLAQMLMLWFHVLAGQNPHTLFYWASTVTSVVAWPIMVFLFRKPASV